MSKTQTQTLPSEIISPQYGMKNPRDVAKLRARRVFNEQRWRKDMRKAYPSAIGVGFLG